MSAEYQDAHCQRCGRKHAKFAKDADVRKCIQGYPAGRYFTTEVCGGKITLDSTVTLDEILPTGKVFL